LEWKRNVVKGKLLEDLLADRVGAVVKNFGKQFAGKYIAEIL
jgi:hypothetical protein